MWNSFDTGDYEGMIAETVSIFGHDGKSIRAYWSRPIGKGPHPSPVLISHMPGWDEWCRETARRFTAHGYSVLCPNIYGDFGNEDFNPTSADVDKLEAVLKELDKDYEFHRYDGRIWLYSGFYIPTPALLTGGRKLKNDGGVVVELERDMVTIKTEPKLIFPKKGPGSFLQAEVTSCGLNDGPLEGKGRYEARIACNLWSKDGVGRYDGKHLKRALAAHLFFTQTGRDREENGDQYIANMRDGATAGFKYFDIKGLRAVSVELSGSANGVFTVSDTPDFETSAASIPVKLTSGKRMEFEAPCSAADGVRALYFRYVGEGAVDFHSFTLR